MPTGETFRLRADQVFKAIGQTLTGTPDGLAIAGGKIVVTGPGRTSMPGVWAGGDCAAGGEDLTVTAVAEGRDAAMDIHAALTGVAIGPSLATLSVSDADARGALSGFIESCPRLLTRDDASGLTRPDDWRGACDAARGWAPTRARAFFAEQFTPVQVGDGKNLVDLTYIDDCVSAHVLAAAALDERPTTGGRAFFISQGTPVPLWEWIARILILHDAPPVQRQLSASSAQFLATIAETVWRTVRLSSDPPLTRFLVKEMSTDHYFDISAARHELGYVPTCSVWEATEKMTAR
jgi:hypothetical protein